MAMLVNVCDVSSIFDSGGFGGVVGLGISLLYLKDLLGCLFDQFRVDCHESFLKSAAFLFKQKKNKSATGVFFHLPNFAWIVL